MRHDQTLLPLRASASPRDPLFLSFSHAETRRGIIPSSRRDGTNQPRVSAKRATLGCCAPRPVPCKGTTGTRNGRRMCGTPTGCLCLSAHTRGGAPSSLTPGCCVSPRWGEPEVALRRTETRKHEVRSGTASVKPHQRRGKGFKTSWQRLMVTVVALSMHCRCTVDALALG